MDLLSQITLPLQLLHLCAHSISNSVADSRSSFLADSEEYGFNESTGFILERPLPSLSAEFMLWEHALEVTSSQVREEWRSQIRAWPVLDVRKLSDERHLQRAHFILAWILHFYVHSIPDKDKIQPVIVPKGVAVPLVAVSRMLGIAPVLCYADTVLWNWEPVDDTKPVSLDNLRVRNLFSGTEDEVGFYLASARVEFVGTQLLQVIKSFRQIRDPESLEGVAAVHDVLVKLKQVILDINEAIQSVRDICDPRVFYWQIRPWYNGDDISAPDGPRWIYEGVAESDRKYTSGPSGGQSTIMHALDIFLDIDHKMNKRPRQLKPGADTTFFERMRHYMPARARKYLESLDDMPVTLRDISLATPSLCDAFNECIKEVQHMRELHMRIATLYILSMAKTAPPGQTRDSMSEEARQKAYEARKGPIRGTGGNELSLLLKTCRDATKATIIENGRM